MAMHHPGDGSTRPTFSGPQGARVQRQSRSREWPVLYPRKVYIRNIPRIPKTLLPLWTLWTHQRFRVRKLVPMGLSALSNPPSRGSSIGVPPVQHSWGLNPNTVIGNGGVYPSTGKKKPTAEPLPIVCHRSPLPPPRTVM